MDVESPTYFGPFSTTVSQHASDVFSQKRGLRIDIQSLYEDTMKRCLGINMQFISSFKHEQEVLLVDQPIPIGGTTLWESKDDILINLLLYSLKTRHDPIRDRNLFYKKLGIKYKKEWKEQVLRHEVLYDHVLSVNKSVLSRLVSELGIVDLLYHSKCCSVFIGNRYISVTFLPQPDDYQFGTWDPANTDYLIRISKVTKSGNKVLCYEERCLLSDFYKFDSRIEQFLEPTDKFEAEQFSEVLQRFHFTASVQDPFGKMILIKSQQCSYLRRDNTMLRFRGNDAFRLNEHVRLIPCNNYMESGGKLNLVSCCNAYVCERIGTDIKVGNDAI